jgi:heterokaryon incompatibility protein (HET)
MPSDYLGGYTALSYVWGSPHGGRPITCDGKRLFVTPNCLSALKHLRNPTKNLIVWIDSACIDQNSIKKKNQQINLTAEIY